MSGPAGFDLLRRVCRRGIPPVPTSTLRLCLELSSDEHCDLDFLIETLETDSRLALKLLILVNQGIDRPAREAATVRQAVRFAGQKSTCEFLWCLAVSDTLQNYADIAPRTRDRLWKHCWLTAVLTQRLAETLQVGPIAHALPAGLAHDIGHLLLIDPAPTLGVVWHTEHDEWVDRDPDLPPEKNHCQLGASLLELWNAPREMVETARHHHVPRDSAEPRVVSLVRLADLLAEHLDADRPEHRLDLEASPAWDVLIETEDWDEVPDVNQLAVEHLPEALLKAERIANLLSR